MPCVLAAVSFFTRVLAAVSVFTESVAASAGTCIIMAANLVQGVTFCMGREGFGLGFWKNSVRRGFVSNQGR